jgi:hypothetical protein
MIQGEVSGILPASKPVETRVVGQFDESWWANGDEITNIPTQKNLSPKP